MEGWISLHRKILDNPIVCKDSDYFSIWCYLLLNATHKEQDKMFANKRITLKKGQLITGRKKIAEQFSVSESKVQRILKKLEIEQQIEQQTCSANRLITILNWQSYQSSEQQNEQQVNNNRTTSEQQVNTNNNVIMKQCNNEIKKSKSKTNVFDDQSFEMKIVEGLILKIKSVNEKFKEPNRQKWALVIDRMIRIDKRTEQELIDILKFSTNDEFWRNIVLSTESLRRNYDKIYMQMKNRSTNKEVTTEWNID